MSKKNTLKQESKKSAEVAEYDWKELLSEARMNGPDRKKEIHAKINDHRTAHERDFDRVVFCTPVRRLKDKTQVFPLDMHDGVRTRLTHSLEVSNLSRSMGIAVVSRVKDLAETPDALRSIPALLAAIALTHDLGNPPFGHQGEEAIRKWVVDHKDEIKKQETGRKFDENLFRDFAWFEGNAQGFRILARLQHQDHRSGMRLTASTLRAFMKYPWSADKASLQNKKFGYFHSEKDVFEWATDQTGCDKRHPLSYLMEVCDDIAYSILDIEDAVKKELFSVSEVISFLSNSTEFSGDARVCELVQQFDSDRKWLDSLTMTSEDGSAIQISNKEIRDSQVDLVRSYAIGLMVSDAIEMFVELVGKRKLDKLSKGIAESFKSSLLMKGFKKFAKLRIYRHPDVLKAELDGHKVIPELMTAFWSAITRNERGAATKADEYVLSMMSPNYIRVYRQSEDLNLPLWYRQIQLVCDQVCGMTDSYAMRTHAALTRLGIVCPEK